MTQHGVLLNGVKMCLEKITFTLKCNHTEKNTTRTVCVEVITEQEVVNRWIFEQGLPTVITTDAHYLRKQDKKIHRAYLKSDEDDETYASGGRETDAFYSTTYFMSEEEIKRVFRLFTTRLH